MKRPFSIRCYLLCALLLSFTTLAQNETDTAPATQKEANYSPRDTVKRILRAISEQSEQELVTHFDLRSSRTLRGVNTQKVIAAFPSTLDKYGSLIPTGLLSDQETGSTESDLAPELERVGQIKVGTDTIVLVLERIQSRNGTARWLVSQQTIVALSEISPERVTSRINLILPQVLIDTTWRGAPVGHWLSTPLLLALSMAIGWLATAMIRRGAGRDSNSKRSVIVSALAIPVGIVATVALFVLLERYLDISILIRQLFGVFTLSALWIALFIFLWALLDNLSARGERTLRAKNRVGGLSLVVFFRASAKTVLLILAVILVLDSNGVDVSTGLAALGIGGIALALGAQKAIENIVGSIVIVVDQPFRVGDFCKIGDMLGTVEKIGLRSTRIRTLNDTLVTYPNGELSSERIENYTMRRKFLLRTVLNLRYETQIKDLENVLNGLRALLKRDQYCVSEGMRVRFIGYGAASLDVEVFVHVYAENFDVFLARQEDLLLSMSHIVESNGSGFAFPSQTVYLSRDTRPQPTQSGDEQAEHR